MAKMSGHIYFFYLKGYALGVGNQSFAGTDMCVRGGEPSVDEQEALAFSLGVFHGTRNGSPEDLLSKQKLIGEVARWLGYELTP